MYIKDNNISYKKIIASSVLLSINYIFEVVKTTIKKINNNNKILNLTRKHLIAKWIYVKNNFKLSKQKYLSFFAISSYKLERLGKTFKIEFVKIHKYTFFNDRGCKN